jgi:hypothetical protein
MKGFLLSLFIGGLLFFISCRNKDQNAGEAGPDNIYFDYKITGQEGDDNLTIMLQYRNDDEEGEALTIKEPGKVVLDAETLTHDSSKMNGPFYETHKPITAFSGSHTIVFTSAGNKEYKEEFNFRPLTLIAAIPDTIQRGELVFDFEGLESEDYVRIVLTDTSYFNDGINRLDTVVNGQIILSKTDLENIANGPVQLEFIREYERPVKKGTDSGGRFQITYSLKREFILKD